MAGKLVAKLTLIEKTPKRCPGALKGKIKIAKDFDAPLPEDILSDFENSLSIQVGRSLERKKRGKMNRGCVAVF